jgi:DNA (cytosine-5)-methyltransferase 1
VFVVGYLGDWRRAAAVLFERESVFGNPPTRGKAWEGIACATPISTRTGRSDDRGDGCDNLVAESHTIAFGGQMSTPQVDVELSQTLQRKNPQAVAVDTYNQAIGDVSIPLRVGNAKDSLPAAMVAFAIDGGNQAASEEVHHSLRTGRDSGDAVAFTTEQTPKFKHDCALTMTKQSPSGGGQPQCVAFKPSHYTRGKDGAPSNVTAPLSADADRGDQDTVVASCEVSSSLRANPGSGWRSNGTPVEGVVISPMAVRRLTPKECERLQGFPDGYTAVTYRGKPAADGPRYRALGNSMAVPVMAWIGQRIQMVEEAADGR